MAHAIVAHITLVPPTEVADEEHLAEIAGPPPGPRLRRWEPFPGRP